MNKEDFTRNRKLPFSKMIVTITKKSIKSIQNMLNETQIYLNKFMDSDFETISNSAYSQARDKLNYTAFIELSDDASDMFYRDFEYKKYKGYRLLSIDGSRVNLPNNENIRKEFSSSFVTNQHKNKEIVQARISVLYDVLNNITLDSVLSDIKTHEIDIAKENHFEKIKSNDLILFDRGYPSYEMFVIITHKYKADYLFRIQKSGYKDIKFMFNNDCNVSDTVVTLKPTNTTLKDKFVHEGLPIEVQVRFIRVVLDNGEIEVLATSILDSEIINTDEFKELYFKRWKIETFYDLLKNRLSLENFSGASPLSIWQDFHSTIFVSNLETLYTYEIDEKLYKNSSENKYRQKINKSVSFNIIKNYCLDLLYSNKDENILQEEMSQLFLTNRVLIKPNRNFKRYHSKKDRYTKSRSQYNYLKRLKKSVF